MSSDRETSKSQHAKGREFGVVVSMTITKAGKEIETKKIDFGKMTEEALNELVEMFTLASKNIEQVKKLTPKFEQMEKEKPAYLD